MTATWPLTGRAEELSLISQLTRRRDGPAGVVLAGAAGVGKTRLAGKRWPLLSSAAR
ncbi:MAG: hypothetical protein ACRDSF_08540 [Pseudonocardiaceae bacterium]